MKSKHYLLLFFAVFSFCFSAKATHITGGQIYWERNATGQFIFYAEMYIDVTPGVAQPFDSIYIFSPIDTIVAHTIGTETFLGGCTTGNYIQGKKVFKSDPITLTGTPPASGWEFYINTCCRGGNVTNINNPSSTGFRIFAKMYQGAGITHPNGQYPVSAQLVDNQAFQLSGGNYSIPLVKNNPFLDSVSVEFSPVYGGTWQVAYEPGYSYTNPFGSTGAVYPPTIDVDNVLRIQPAIVDYYTTGFLAKTYVNGALYSEQLLDVVTVVDASPTTNSPPDISINPANTNVTVNTLPPNPNTGVANVHNITIAQGSMASIGLIGLDTLGEKVKPILWNKDAYGVSTVSAWDSLSGEFSLEINPNNFPYSLGAGQTVNFTVFVGSYDYGCKISGGSMHQFNVTAQIPTPCANICMTALDTANLKAYVYFDAPELGTGDIYHYWHYESLGGSGLNFTSSTLPDKDTILELSVINSNSFHTLSIFTDAEVTSGSLVPCDSTVFGNLPVSANKLSPSLNQITANFYNPIGLSEIKLLSRPAGTSQYSTIQVISNPTFSSTTSGTFDLYDTLTTPGSYEYMVEATPAYKCDTLNMNLKNWIYFTQVSNYSPLLVTIGLEENIQNALPLYPNPTSGILNIPLENISQTEVFDLSGKILLKFEKETQIDISSLNTGIYLLVVRDEAGNVYPTRVQKK